MFNRAGTQISGFTLSEILMVCAILILLSGILIPALGSARERAKTSDCLSNGSQLAQAMFLYVEDDGGALAREGRDEHYWLDQLNPFGATEGTIKCPDFTPIPEVGRGTGWSLNVCLSDESTVASTATTVMFTETTEGIGHAPGRPEEIVWPKEVSAPDSYLYSNSNVGSGEIYTMNLPYGSERHFRRSNYVFVDGHVTSYKPESIRLPVNLSCHGGPDQWTGPANGPTFRIQSSTRG